MFIKCPVYAFLQRPDCVECIFLPPFLHLPWPTSFVSAFARGGSVCVEGLGRPPPSSKRPPASQAAAFTGALSSTRRTNELRPADRSLSLILRTLPASCDVCVLRTTCGAPTPTTTRRTWTQDGAREGGGVEAARLKLLLLPTTTTGEPLSVRLSNHPHILWWCLCV